MPASISAAMIVKDEGKHLDECLNTIRDLVSEICVVDTGSQDHTLAIARHYQAKIRAFLWCDDFAAARNESLRLCTGDWILILDADERIAAGDVVRLRGLANGPTDVCYRFVTRNYTNTVTLVDFKHCAPDDPLARGFAGWYPSAKVRLFPNGCGGRFEGKVHELVHRSLERNGIRVADCDVPIHHYPLLRSPERLREKQELYLQLGHGKVAAAPNDPKGYLELGNQYVEVGDFERAAAAYREALKIDPSSPLALRDLGGALHYLKRGEEAKRALRLALQLDPSLSSAWRNLGVVLVEDKSWEAAVECFEEGLALDPAWTDGYRYLGVALEGVGRVAEAGEASEKALKANVESSECLKAFVHQMLRLERRGHAREVLLEIIGGGAKNADVHNALGELFYYDNMTEHSKVHFRTAAENGMPAAYNNLGVVLFKERKHAEAKEAFEKCLEADAGHHGARSNLEKVLKYLPAAGPTKEK